jgi:diaminopimelate decarboxylase
MNIDMVRENISLPLLNKGDKIVIHHVGAYNMTQWMQFITLRPNVVMIDMDGKPHLIRKNESIDSIENLEEIPPHLSHFEL